jgi:hypothetical protein
VCFVWCVSMSQLHQWLATVISQACAASSDSKLRAWENTPENVEECVKALTIVPRKMELPFKPKPCINATKHFSTQDAKIKSITASHLTTPATSAAEEAARVDQLRVAELLGWEALDAPTKDMFEARARQDAERYAREMELLMPLPVYPVVMRQAEATLARLAKAEEKRIKLEDTKRLEHVLVFHHNTAFGRPIGFSPLPIPANRHEILAQGRRLLECLFFIVLPKL